VCVLLAMKRVDPFVQIELLEIQPQLGFKNSLPPCPLKITLSLRHGTNFITLDGRTRKLSDFMRLCYYFRYYSETVCFISI
jgi:hypothetical protein